MKNLVDSLQTDELILDAIMEICLTDDWNDECMMVWETPNADQLADIKNSLPVGEYCYGIETIVIN